MGSNSLQEAPPIVFLLGVVVATPRALTVLSRAKASYVDLLYRHRQEHYPIAPDATAIQGSRRVLSSHSLGDEETIWVITEQDSSVTTVLLPDDFT